MSLVRLLKRIAGKRRTREVPICIFTYHKIGNVLFSKVFGDICDKYNWRLETPYNSQTGKHSRIPPSADVMLVRNSQMDIEAIEGNFLGIHLVRDPRDVIVSGYLYHRRCSEEWCTNKDLRDRSPIRFPQVPYSQQYRPEEWKKAYLESLGGRSYQENLLKMEQSEGLLFEMDHYGGWTIEAMTQWKSGDRRILEVNFEDLMNSYDHTFRLIFSHLQISDSELEECVSLAARHDIRRHSEKELERNMHVTSRQTTRWRDYFGPKEKEAFLNRFGNALIELGYEFDNEW